MRYRLRTLLILMTVVAMLLAAYRIGYQHGIIGYQRRIDAQMESLRLNKHGDPFDMSGK